MKNLLLILPLSLAMTFAYAQEPKKDVSKDTKIASAASLDGKSFKITLSTRAVDASSLNKKDVTEQTQTGVGTKTGATERTTGSGAMDNVPPTGNTDVAPGKSPEVEGVAGNTQVNPDNTNTGITQEVPVTPQPAPIESLDKKKLILQFENGMIHSTTLASKGMETCPYTVTSSEANLYTFSSNCRSASSKVRGMWSGMVDGNSIRGNFTWTTEDGTNLSYTFTGSKASQKDIDANRELGLK